MEQTQQMSAMSDRLKKYKPSTRVEDVQAEAKPEERISSTPRANNNSGGAENLYQELSSIELGLADLVDSYGKLDVRFGDVVGSNRYLKPVDTAKILAWNLLLQKKKAREVKIGAQRRKGNLVDFLSDRMAETIEEQHQYAIKGVALAKGVHIQNTNHRKTVSKNLVSRLTGSYTSDSDLSMAERDVLNRQAELVDYEGIIADYESQIIEARKIRDTEKLDKLTADLTQLIRDQGIVIDGKQDADNIVHEIRRKVLDYSEGVRSARNALEALKVSDLQCNSLIDSWDKLEIKYRHAKDDMMEIYRIQGKIAAYGSKGREMNKMLSETAALYRRLLEHNEKLVVTLSQETFDLIKTDLYDPVKCKEIEARLSQKLEEHKKMEMEWAQNQQLVTERLRKAGDFVASTPLPQGPSYTRQN
jgi:hypothetical protein